MLSRDFKQRTRVGVARLASRLSKFVVVGHPFDGATMKIPKLPLEGVCLSFMS
jgi:hypothetical protein